MTNKILLSLSFRLKFMKLAEGSFHKFHEMTTRVNSSTYKNSNNNKIENKQIKKVENVNQQTILG